MQTSGQHDTSNLCTKFLQIITQNEGTKEIQIQFSKKFCAKIASVMLFQQPLTRTIHSLQVSLLAWTSLITLAIEDCKTKLNPFSRVLISLLHYLLETHSRHLLSAIVQVPSVRKVFNSLVTFVMKALAENFVFWELRSQPYARLSTIIKVVFLDN